MRIFFCLLPLLLCLSLLFWALFFSSVSYHDIDLLSANAPPSLRAPFGTDDLGRDLLCRLGVGIGISLCIGVASAVLDLTIGLLWGGLAALLPAMPQEAMMRIADLISTLPTTMVAILLLLALGPGISTMILALALTGWVTMARITRSCVASLLYQEFIFGARLAGIGPLALLIRHMLPNLFTPLITTLLITIPNAIFLEAFLSFIGLGVPPPMASLGSMAYEGLSALEYYPWRLLAPAIMTTLLVISFHIAAQEFKVRYAV